MKHKVLICDTVSQKCIELLRSMGFEVEYQPKITHEELVKKVEGYDAIIVRSRTKVTKEVIKAGSRLKVIGRAGAGLDNIDLHAAKELGIEVLNTPEAPANAVAELVIGLMLCLTRGICKADTGMRAEKWLKSELLGMELRGKTIGIIGIGRVGTRVARLAKAFDMRILGRDIRSIEEGLLKELGMKMVSLEELLSESDFVVLCVPLTNETYHMIDEERLKKMKRTAYLINISRGEVVDEKALLKALKEGMIAGAALDVYEVEPPHSYELMKLPNVVCTPHIGAQTVEAQDLAAAILVEKLGKALSSRDE